MTMNNKDSFMNMLSSEKIGNTNKEEIFRINNNFKTLNKCVSIRDNRQSYSESANNDISSSKEIKQTLDEYRDRNQKDIDIDQSSKDVDSSKMNQKSYLNYLNLPKYGLAEKSTQTLLTGRDIEELEHMKMELIMSRKEVVHNVLKNNYDVIKKLVPSEISIPEKIGRNFVGIKRYNDSPLKQRTKKYISSNTDDIRTTHVHFKNQPKVKKSKTIKTRKAVSVSNVTETNNFIMFNEFKLDKSNPKIFEELNISDMINDIKSQNSNKNINTENKGLKKVKKDINKNKFPKEVSSLFDDKNFQKHEETIIKPQDKLKVKKFDPYQYYKEEYKQTHPSLTEDVLEKECRKAWNVLEKDVKNIYNIQADSDRKVYKQKKKIEMSK